MTGDSQRREASRWPVVLRFCTVFLLLVGGYAAIVSTPWVVRYVHAPMSRLVALSSVAPLSWLGDAGITGTYIRYEAFEAVIVEACNGILPTWVYLSAVLALPSGWRAKLWGALIGIPFIFLVNVLRVVSLMLLGAARPDIVERVHIHVWQTLVVFLAMGLWIFWAERFVRPQRTLRR